MGSSALIDKMSDAAFAKLKEANGNIESLSEPYKTIVLVYSAQGVIDNGGLVYFFENDWPNHPPYLLFIDAYMRIGATEAARAIDSALNYFDFESPELNKKARLEFLSSLPAYHYGFYPHDFLKLNEAVIGNDLIWEQLHEYVAGFKIDNT